MIGSLTLDQLRVLVAIADEGSFSAAGRALNRAQSVISQTVANLEAAQGVALFDRSGYRPRATEAGHVLTEQARHVLRSAARFEAVATGMRDGLEAELTIAIDPLVPSDAVIEPLRRLGEAFPALPVTFSTEGLGGALRRLRRDEAALGVCILLPAVPPDIVAHPLRRIAMVPVVAPTHPLAALGRPATTGDLEPHVQLVLSDPVETAGPSYGLTSARLWRFVDLARRLDFLQAGFGWCRMPEHLVAPSLADGRLLRLAIEADTAPADDLTVYAAHRRDRTLGPAGRWLLDALREAPAPPT